MKQGRGKKEKRKIHFCASGELRKNKPRLSVQRKERERERENGEITVMC